MLLNYSDTGTAGTPIVLIHGMAGSNRYWNRLLPFISKGHRIIAVDLLGFGRSPMPKNVTYNYQTHIQSIIETLDYAGISKPFTLVGHSMGGLIALRLAATHPSYVRKLILVAMPIYTSPDQARRAITGSSRLKDMAYYGLSSKILCNAWCRYLRPISRRAAPKYLPQLSKEAAMDSVLHTWQAYAESRHFVLENQDVNNDISRLKKPAALIYGSSDIPEGLGSLKTDLKQAMHTVTVLKGTHQIINEHPKKIAELILS